jgi:hypothetical protein
MGEGRGTERTVSSEGELPSGWIFLAPARRSAPPVFKDVTSMAPHDSFFSWALDPRSCPPDSWKNVDRLFLNAFR